MESFVSIYHLYHLFGIIYKSIFYNFKTINIRGNFIKKCPLGDPCISVVWHSFSFFSVITIIEITSCIFVLKCFSCSNSLVPFPFLLHHYIIGDVIKWGNREAMNKTDKIIISLRTSNVAIHTIKLILIYFVTITLFKYFSALLSLDEDKIRWLTFWEIWKKFQNWRISSIISFIKWSIILCDIAGLQHKKQWNPFFCVEKASWLFSLLLLMIFTLILPAYS